jgi:hypothetical protein
MKHRLIVRAFLLSGGVMSLLAAGGAGFRH